MLPFASNLDSATDDSFNCDESQFRDADTYGVDGLQEQIAALVLLCFGGAEKTFIFELGEPTVTGRKDPPLNLQILDTEVVPFAEGEDAAEGGK